jgi:hypothetical protein
MFFLGFHWTPKIFMETKGSAYSRFRQEVEEFMWQDHRDPHLLSFVLRVTHIFDVNLNKVEVLILNLTCNPELKTYERKSPGKFKGVVTLVPSI